MTQKAEIQYPKNFDIKLIISAEIPTEETKKNIAKVFTQCKVVFSFVNVRASAKGNYLSYAYNIDIESREQMEQTYAALKDVPGLKFAL